MKIKQLEPGHLQEAMDLVWEVFQEFEAPEYSLDGIIEFKSYIETDRIKQQLRMNEMIIWGCFDEGVIVGIIAIRQCSHISLMFVDKNYHRKGIARGLLNRAVDYLTVHSELFAGSEITVNSSPYAELVYRRLGFEKTGEEQTVNGIRFIPMKMRVGASESCVIRPMREEEQYLLSEFLYEAIYQRNPDAPVPRTIIQEPEIQIFIREFNKADDCCLAAEINKKIVGAVWTRILSGPVKGFGHVDEQTPEFAISLYPEYRGRGIGSRLMNSMLYLLKEKGYKQASLAVQKDNYALGMYQKAGFQIVGESQEEYIMVRCLNS